jgi:hypothetical protein
MAKASDQSKTGFITIATVPSRAEARAIAAKLEAAGIQSLLSVERAMQPQSTGNRWFGGTKVQVTRSDVERALRVLQRPRGEEGGSREAVSEATEANSRRRIDLDSWRGAALAVSAMIALAALLALWLF